VSFIVSLALVVWHHDRPQYVSCPYGLLTETEKHQKTRIGLNVPYGRSNLCVILVQKVRIIKIRVFNKYMYL